MEEKVLDLFPAFAEKQDLKALQAFINDAIEEGYETFELQITHGIFEYPSQIEEIELILHA